MAIKVITIITIITTIKIIIVFENVYKKFNNIMKYR